MTFNHFGQRFCGQVNVSEGWWTRLNAECIKARRKILVFWITNRKNKTLSRPLRAHQTADQADQERAPKKARKRGFPLS